MLDKCGSQIAAVSGDLADAATVDLPVYTPATTEAFATYGVVDEGAIVQPVAKPEDVFPQFGGLEIATSSTALQELTDAVLYLKLPIPLNVRSRSLRASWVWRALRDVLDRLPGGRAAIASRNQRGDGARHCSPCHLPKRATAASPSGVVGVNLCPITASMSPMPLCARQQKDYRRPRRDAAARARPSAQYRSLLSRLVWPDDPPRPQFLCALCA